MDFMYGKDRNYDSTCFALLKLCLHAARVAHSSFESDGYVARVVLKLVYPGDVPDLLLLRLFVFSISDPVCVSIVHRPSLG